MTRGLLVQGSLLLLVIACGKSAPAVPPPPAPALATGLSYDDPPTADWRLVKDASSTPSLLVLNLAGPSGLKTRGAAFNLQLPPPVRAHPFAQTGFPLQSTGVYELLNSQPGGAADPLEPMLLGGAVKQGNLLTVGVFQKDRRIGAKESGRALFQIALLLDPSAKSLVGDALPLAMVKSRYMAEDIGAFSPGPTREMIAKARLVPMSIAVGALHAN